MFVDAVRPNPSFDECAHGANDSVANDGAASSAGFVAVDVLLSRVASLTDDALVTESRRIASAISAAQAELAAVLAEVESRQLHGSWDCSTIERFAGWHCQVTPSRAASLTTLGRALRALPVLAAAVVDGSLAADKAVAVARVAAPDTEAALVELAVHATVDQTRRICGAWRRADDTATADGTAPANAQAEARAEEQAIGRVLVIHDDDGVELRARFDHVHGALVLAALDTSTTRVRTEREHAAALAPPGPRTSTVGAVPASVDEIPRERLTREQWRAQGLLRMCEFASAASPTELQPSGFTAQLVVHIPVDTLLDPFQLDDLGSDSSRSDSSGAGSSGAGSRESSGLESGAADVLEPRGVRIRRDAARWLACDAGLLTVLEDGNGDPLHLGRRRTTVTPQQRRAVHARDRTCAWPGCTATVVQLHHRHHRSFGGHDDIENLVPECRYHHAAIHRRRITVTRDHDGVTHHWRQDGTEILANPSALDPRPVAAGHATDLLQDRQRSLGVDITDRRRSPQWMNDPMRMIDAIDAVLQRRDAALRRTRATGPASRTDGGPDPGRESAAA